MEYPFKDLLPLDEATAREGYYKDWTHIDANTFHQISELVKFIREKGYGSDTREAIAQALERIYHDAAMSGNANMEVSMARKHFKDLASRLDASDDKLNSATTQLAQKVDKGNVSVSDINKNLGKLDQTYMTDEFLQQMAGDTPINAVPADNSITSSKVADGAITPTKTNFLTQDDLTSSATIQTGGFYQWNNAGAWFADTGYVAFKNVIVETGKTYLFHNASNVSYWTTTGTYVGGTSISTNPYQLTIANPGIYELRFAVLNANQSLFKVVEKDLYLINTLKVQDSNLSGEINASKLSDDTIFGNKIAENEITIDHLAKVKNLFDKATLQSGIVLDNGTVGANDDYNHFEIDLKPNTYYSLPNIINPSAVLFESGGAKIALKTNTSSAIKISAQTFKTTATTTRALFNVYVGDTTTNPNHKDKYMLVESDNYPTGYLEFGTTYKLDWLDEYQPKTWSDKTAAFLGDSLTEKNQRSRLNYHDYINAETGLKAINLGKSGTGYKRYDESNNAFYQRVANIPTNVDATIIFGSFNDLYTNVPLGTVDDTTADTLAGSMNLTIQNYFTRMGTTPVGIVSPTPWYEPSIAVTDILDSNNKFTAYVDILEKVAIKNGLPFLDLYRHSGLRPWDSNFRTLAYSLDDGNGVHPDENGHKLFYPQIREFLKTLI